MPNRSPDRAGSALPVAAAFYLSICVGLWLAGCATEPPPSAPGGAGAYNGSPIGPPPTAQPALKRAMVARATKEWEEFGRQTVVYRGKDESIPHVGYWEDDDEIRSRRVNMYWRAVGQPGLDGMDCKQPWSAAFVSWVMKTSGVPEYQFRPAIAHWVYLAQAIDEAPFPGRWFVPRRIEDYSPEPGDLICASRGPRRPSLFQGYTTPGRLNGTNTHCDLVVEKSGTTLEAIGGNVRNSVSRISVELDAKGHLQPVPRRPWFMILQNRL